MAQGETVITIIGNLTADPELRYTQNGLAVANFTVASTPREFDRQANEWKDGEALFMRCSAWRELGEHIASSLAKGTRVIVTGRLKQRSYDDKEGNKRTVVELDVDEAGPSLRYATASVIKAQSGGQRGQAGPQQGGAQQAWAQAAPQGYPPQQQGYPQGYPQGGQPMPPQGQPPQGYPPQQQAPQQPDVWSTPGAPQYDENTPF